jgi:hypothetical protein
MVTHYKGYRIEALEIEPGRWRVRLQRTDGHKIKIYGGPDLLDSAGHDAHTAEQALSFGKKVIDSGGIGRGSKFGDDRKRLN